MIMIVLLSPLSIGQFVSYYIVLIFNLKVKYEDNSKYEKTLDFTVVD